MKGKIKKAILTIAMIFALVLGSFPVNLILGNSYAEAAVLSGNKVETNLSGYKFKSSRYMQIHAVNFKNKEMYVGSCTEAGMQMKKFEIEKGGEKVLVFCAEHGVTQSLPHLLSQFHQI